MTSQHNNQKFSTKDQENDNQKDQNCAQAYKGGWWYNTCHHSNLNGLYHRGKHESFADGVNWHSWKGYNESLEWTEIKVRPKSFRSSYASEVTPVWLHNGLSVITRQGTMKLLATKILIFFQHSECNFFVHTCWIKIHRTFMDVEQIVRMEICRKIFDHIWIKRAFNKWMFLIFF